MATNVNHKSAPKKRSKRERRNKIIIYIMIILMLVSTLTYGLAFFI
ncbi:stressosome-associated protein Prli42 [Oceanobacillus saliphilus]|nr:stressosome-associated protein Prli42 [Oceanobacillus saliphilus]